MASLSHSSNASLSRTGSTTRREEAEREAIAAGARGSGYGDRDQGVFEGMVADGVGERGGVGGGVETSGRRSVERERERNDGLFRCVMMRDDR